MKKIVIKRFKLGPFADYSSDQQIQETLTKIPPEDIIKMEIVTDPPYIPPAPVPTNSANHTLVIICKEDDGLEPIADETLVRVLKNQ